MKKLLNAGKYTNTIDLALLVVRISIASLMLVHGIPKMGMLFSGNAIMFPSIFGLSPELSLSLTVFAEVICSAFVLTGFGTRLAVVPLAITMLVAILIVHANDPFTNKELAIHYLFTYVVLFITGSGRYSLDYLLQPNNSKKTYLAVNTEDPTLSIYQ
ncbi:MAG: DoxX family protein [Chitinophagaceae bacterium]|nr:MAG: DoxX family protein [Chitinophagaceae bacterium]